MKRLVSLLTIVLVALALGYSGCGRSSNSGGQVQTGTPDTGDKGDDDTGQVDGALTDTKPKGPAKTCKGCGKLLPAGVGESNCNLDGNLPGPSRIKLVPAFAKLGIPQPIHITHPHDGTNRLAVATRPGEIYVFDNDDNATEKTRVLDLRNQINTKGEGGLLSIAYHPQFKTKRTIYVNYTSTGQFNTVVSEFTAYPNKDLFNKASERKLVVIKQPYSNHDGGHVLFDSKGKLLIGMGDGGWANDPLNAGQDPKQLLGKILRIDVDVTKGPGGKPYGIPKDNPFVNDAKHHPETYAWGTRNPWRMAVDRENGEIWAADVGQNKWEEVDIIVAGGNYGWRKMEGKHCFNPSTNCNDGTLIEPVAEIKQPLGRSITGGEVYRGKKYPGLTGAYIFADYVTGRFWLTRSKVVAGKRTFDTKEVLDTSYKPVSFGEDRDAEVYMTQLFGGQRIFRVVEAKGVPVGNPVAQTLSATGCFASTAPLKPGTGMVAFGVNAPLWSDGAAKQRWLLTPKGAKPDKAKPPLTAATDDTAPWSVPVGTIAVKHFFADAAAPAGHANHVPYETRFIVRRSDGWRMLTYKWRADGKDADLVINGAKQTYKTAAGNVNWVFPSMDDCGACHAADKGSKLLGLSNAQLDSHVDKGPYDGHNQLDVWLDGGLLGNYDRAAKHTVFNDPVVDSGDATTRARTYLHVQCASCHQPGASASTEMDLRFDRTLKQTGACDKSPQEGDFGVAGAKLIALGAAAKSVLVLRMKSTDAELKMPNKGVTIAHQAGIKLLEAWIGTLKDCGQ